MEDVGRLKKRFVLGLIVILNVFEVEVLMGIKINLVEDMRKVVRVFVEELSVEVVVVKGGYLNFIDVFYWNGEVFEILGEYVEGFIYGIGCVFLMVFVVFIVKGLRFLEVVEKVKCFVEGVIRFLRGEGKVINFIWEF